MLHVAKTVLAVAAAAGQTAPSGCAAAANFTRRLAGMLAIAALVPASAAAQVRGETVAVAAAERLLATVGGRDDWRSARTFYVEERVYLRSGEVAELKIWRDLQTGARRLERTTPGSSFKEWLAAGEGWDSRDGQRRDLPPEELAMERRGLLQEPYAVYRRLAVQDPRLRVELRDPHSLYVFDGDEHLLCWFLLNDRGALVSWANVYNGAINQHFYGPIVDVGDANLPKWGASPTGFRFEYVAAKFLAEPPTPPSP
jgi:hypothetical protein